MEVPSTLISSKRPGRRAHKKEVFVSQLSKWLCETDLIRKASRSLLQYISNKAIDWVSSVAQELDKDTDSVEHDEDSGIDDDT